MASFFYNAKSEAYHKMVMQSKEPTIQMPDNVFPVKTDDGDTIYLPTTIFTESATIGVSTLDCAVNEKFTYVVSVMNTKGSLMSSQNAGLAKAAASQVASNVAKTAAGAGFVARSLVGNVVGGPVGALLGADKTGMGADDYHTIKDMKSAAGRNVRLFISGEKA
jgi:hypothetical protein